MSMTGDEVFDNLGGDYWMGKVLHCLCKVLHKPMQEEVLHPLVFAVVPSVKGARLDALANDGETRIDPLFQQQDAQGIRVLPLIGGGRATLLPGEVLHQGRSHLDVPYVVGAEEQLQCATLATNQRVDLAGQPATAPLGTFLSAGGECGPKGRSRASGKVIRRRFAMSWCRTASHARDSLYGAGRGFARTTSSRAASGRPSVPRFFQYLHVYGDYTLAEAGDDLRVCLIKHAIPSNLTRGDVSNTP